jgi:hypothetical protein
MDEKNYKVDYSRHVDELQSDMSRLKSIFKLSHNKITAPKVKKFVLRNSLLTNLFETNFQVVKNVAVIFFIIHFLSLLVNDYVNYEK